MTYYNYDKTDVNIERYKTNGKKILENSRQILNKAVPIIPEKKTDIDAPIMGFELEHNQEEENLDNEAKDNKNVTNSESGVNDTYSDLIELQNEMNKKALMSEKENIGLESVSEFVDTIEDIEDAGQRHIDELSQKYPEGGNLSVSAYTAYQTGGGENTTSVYGNVSNIWQNRKQDFAIKANGMFGYERTKQYGDINNPLENPFEEYIPEDAQETSEEGIQPDLAESEPSKKTQFGKIELGIRKDCQKLTYGIGAVSNFYSDGNQVHDQYISGKYKGLDISGDLMRRTVISRDEITGERITNSEMKLKVSLLDRNKDENSEEEIQPNLTSDENNSAVSKRSGRVKNSGSGFDIDFKYDESVCGFAFEYGINPINKENTKLTVAPVAAVYDYTSPADSDDAEALKGTIGVVTDYQKKWKNGQKFEASLYLAANRVVQNGSRPADSSYAFLESNYRSAKGSLNVNAQAGVVNVDQINMKFVQVNANQRIKNGNIGIQAAYNDITAFGGHNKDFQIYAKYTQNISYGKKKK